jgi:anti-sigma factor RsiW
MTHPTREEWITYLYDEFDKETRANLTAHLHVCPDCKTTLGKWRGTMAELNEWKAPTRNKSIAIETARPILRWAIAALIVLGFAFGFGRLSSTTSANVANASGLLPVLRQELQRV